MRYVQETDELRRVLALPRREPAISAELVGELSRLLSRDDLCPGAKLPPNDLGLCVVCDQPLRLKPLQALALHDMYICGGAFLSLDVGEGKTLISLLAPYVLNSEKPLLLLKAHLVGKTANERAALARHWRIPNNIFFQSYTMLGLPQCAVWLEEVYKPDLIVADESQSLKNKTAAGRRRVERYIEKHPTTRYVPMTGTIMRTSIQDFAPQLVWALKEGAPVPRKSAEIEEWAFALDAQLDDEFSRVEPGALLAFADGIEGDDVTRARHGFRRRLRETPGVICSAEGGTDVGNVRLEIRALRYDLSATTAEHFRRLRQDKVTPDGRELWEASEVWMYARELALGFHQVWNPPAPDDWRAARRAWFSWVREIISRSRTLDSPDHIAQALDAIEDGRIKNAPDRLRDGIPILAAWRAIKDKFTPNPVPVWHDDSALNVAAQWMRTRGPGIVWTEHIPFGQRLAELTGAKYYGAEGFAPDGEFIDHGDPKRSLIASVKANREGRNLQKKWSRNLIVTPPEGADLAHQLIGRTHRPGQRDAVVMVDVFLGCMEHARAMAKAREGARSTRDTVGAQNKLLLAHVFDWPSHDEIATWSGPRWGK